MLRTLQRFMNSGKPIYGMHRGTVGFLMNEFSEERLRERLAAARRHRDPSAADARARRHRAMYDRHHAINEVSLFRQTYQAARLRILVDGEERLAELVADGVLVATPGGLDRLQSLGAGADHSDRRAAAGAHADQPVPAAALARRAAARQRARDDRGARSREAPGRRRRRSRRGARRCSSVDISMDHTIAMHMLFDPGHSLDERILREQFGY